MNMEISSIPIPTLLVLAGIVAILIALVKISSKSIGFKCVHPKLVGIFGSVLLILGLLSSGLLPGVIDVLDLASTTISPSDPNSTLAAEDTPIQTVTATVMENPTSSNELTPTEVQTEETTETEDPTVKLPEITINYTSDNANIEENINGKAKNIPEGDEIWIFVHPNTVNKYYPQSSSAVIQNGEWSLSVGIGSENDDNIKFDIIAVLANEEAQKEINTYFETCEETGEWPGMDKIPDSAKEYDRVTVTRESIDPIDPEIQITYPVEGAKVGIKESITGTQKNIPDDKTLWIVVFPYESYNFHPVKEVRVHDDISDFTVPVTIGTDENSGDEFDIIAVLADEEAQEVFANYLETAAEQQNWPGISNLPEGAEEMYRVTVTRK